MSIIENLKWRYATKKFDTTKKLSDAQLSILKEAFNLTPLSYGLQTLKLLVVENKSLRQELMQFAYNQPQVVEASHLLIFCTQTQIDGEVVDDYFENVKTLRATPDDIIEPYKAHMKSTIEAMPEDKRLDWAAKQAYIALGNLMTVCAVEGIDCCPMEGFVPEAFDKVLNLAALNLKSVLLLPVGIRAADDMFSELKKVRKPLIDTVIEL